MKVRIRRFLKIGAVIVGVLVVSVALWVLIGVRASDHPTKRSELGTSSSSGKMSALIDLPGPIEVETVVGATWQVERSGLINLKHPRATELKDGLEPIEIYLHVLRHPKHGSFLIDTGVEKALRDDREHAAMQGPITSFMHLELMEVQRDTASVVAAEPKLGGVLLTHLHYDHISGMPDVPKGTPIYAGPGETSQRFFLNAFVKSTTDRALAGHEPISEWSFEPDTDGRFEAVLDVFGDETLFAIWVPGHTAGSTAYLARTPKGPVLFVGDTCHTTWGWDHGVEPGEFTRDRTKNAQSLQRLRDLVEEHPSIEVRLGHQGQRER